MSFPGYRRPPVPSLPHEQHNKMSTTVGPKKKSSVSTVAAGKKVDASSVDVTKSMLDAAEQEKAALLRQKELAMRQFEDRTPGGLARAQKYEIFVCFDKYMCLILTIGTRNAWRRSRRRWTPWLSITRIATSGR